ncbi:hypothetical protein [Faunimonas sp. B44]|uniref:hypothetical protein n=1 Tax=Faunimonas sp. B44 TaxID=3461493 RepID=UPI004044D70C
MAEGLLARLATQRLSEILSEHPFSVERSGVDHYRLDGGSAPARHARRSLTH